MTNRSTNSIKKSASHVGKTIPTQGVTNQSLTDYYQVITSEIYDMDFKNFRFKLEPEFQQIQRTLNKFKSHDMENFRDEYR